MIDWTQVRTLAITAIAFVGVGCGSDTGNGPLAPEVFGYTAQVQGDYSRSIGGDAVFGRSEDPYYGEVFVVALEVPGSDGFIALARKNTSRPVVGTYTVADVTENDVEELPQDEFFAFYVTGSGETLQAVFLGTAGSVTITASSARALSGSFQFDALGFVTDDPTSELSVRLSGSFTARAVSAAVETRIAAALVGRGF
jgi:hypothetical protein